MRFIVSDLPCLALLCMPLLMTGGEQNDDSSQQRVKFPNFSDARFLLNRKQL